MKFQSALFAALSQLLWLSEPIAAFAPPRVPSTAFAVASTKRTITNNHATLLYAATEQEQQTKETTTNAETTATTAVTSADGVLKNNPVTVAQPELSLPEEKEELSETKRLMQKVKEAGTAGIISYALWELGFWAISVPVVVLGYREVTGHFPDFSNKEDMAKLGAEAFAFVNFARFAVPLRIGLALSTTPWIEENIVDRFLIKKEGGADGEESS